VARFQVGGGVAAAILAADRIDLSIEMRLSSVIFRLTPAEQYGREHRDCGRRAAATGMFGAPPHHRSRVRMKEQHRRCQPRTSRAAWAKARQDAGFEYAPPPAGVK